MLRFRFCGFLVLFFNIKKYFTVKLDRAIKKCSERKHRVFLKMVKSPLMVSISFHLLPSQMEGKAYDKTQNPLVIKKRNLRWRTSAVELVLVV